MNDTLWNQNGDQQLGKRFAGRDININSYQSKVILTLGDVWCIHVYLYLK